MALTCGNKCAPLSWDVVYPHVFWGFTAWMTVFCGGICISVGSKTSNMDWWKTLTGYMKRRLQRSAGWYVALISLCFLQCLIFSIRTYTLSASTLELLIDLLAVFLFAVELMIAWLHENIVGIKEGVVFSFSFEAVIGSMVIPSVMIMMLAEFDGQKSWFTFSFLSAVRILSCWGSCLEMNQVDLQTIRWQITNVFVTTFCTIFIAATTMMVLENLGDPEILLSHNSQEWSVLSSFYYVFVTISTVGYGDMSPSTGLGRIFAIVAIIGGIASFSIAMGQVMEVFRLNKLGRGSFIPHTKRFRHIIVCGNPAIGMVKNFINELFHPDHADDALDLEVVFLFPGRNATMESAQEWLALKDNMDIAPRVHVLQGSVLDAYDMVRVKASQAHAVFVMPNMFSEDLVQEDSENVVRVLAIRRAVPNVRCIVLLVKAENRQLLMEGGQVQNKYLLCVAVDQFKLELVGKTCQTPGFAALVCNLCKTIGECDGEDDPGWQREYDQGLGNELYEVELSTSYASKEATFGEAVLDVLEQTEGTVYLIGLIEAQGEDVREEKKILINPGPSYPVKSQKATGVRTNGIFIAPDREAIIQCEEGQVFLGKRDRPRNADEDQAGGRDEPEWSGHDLKAEERRLSAQAEADAQAAQGAGLSIEQQQHAQNLMKLQKMNQEAQTPTAPPLEVLARGGHILFISVGARGSDELRLGARHFIRPLRPSQAHDPKAVKEIVPIIVLAPTKPRDWHTVATFKEVYFLEGSPLSLFDLERANFRAASTIFINAVGGGGGQFVDPYMADSEAIFCSRLIESQIGVGVVDAPDVIAELTFDANFPFIPLPGAGGRSGPDPMAESDSESSEAVPELCSKLAISEYFRQPRFACGRLFISNVVTSLVVNTFYNPSLAQLVGAMISAQISLVTVPREWEGKSYFEYFDHLLWEKQLMAIGIFRCATGKLAEARPRTSVSGDAPHLAGLPMAIAKPLSATPLAGLLKGTEKPRGATSAPPPAYVYCAPPAKEASMNHNDRVLCFGVMTVEAHSPAGHSAGHRSSFMDARTVSGLGA